MTTDKRPNILWISFEDTNPFYGCYGDKVARTPNVDKLAADGCRWPLTFSTAGVCAPARSAVITGMYPISIGTHHMRTTHRNRFTPEMPTPYSAVIPHYVKCLPEYLRAVGYYCTNNLKTDYQFDSPQTAWDECGDQAHWRNRLDPDQPFFAVFNPTMTHESGMWEKKGDKEQTYTFDPDDMELPPYFPDTPKVREAMARMYTNIETADSIMGELLDQLEEDGLMENTIVFHWSDHGPMPRGKRWPYDSGIHVPMIVRWPGELEPGMVSNELLSTIDLAPTALALCGVDIPWHMQGQPFLGTEKAMPRDYIFASRDRFDESYDMIRAVRDRRFKYIRNYYPLAERSLWVPYRNRHPILEEIWRLHLDDKLEGPQKLLVDDKRPVEELYDTEADPWEINNLAADPAYSDDLNRLRMVLDDWRAEVGDMGEIDEAEMVEAWYPNGVRPQTTAPIFIPISADDWGREASNGGQLKGPALIQLHCSTQGASIAWRTDQDKPDYWRLYTEPIRVEKGESLRIHTKSIRIGYLESQVRDGYFVAQ
jgi:N-sulfoglucosamine sulfohydrolase